VVLSHLRALAAQGNPGVTVTGGDVRDPAAILRAVAAGIDRADRGFGAYSAGATQVYNHTVEQFASFFGSLGLIPPGVADAREWRPDWEQPIHLPDREGQVIVGVACTSQA
jgi:S-adenosyl methyltransferase